MAEFIIVLVSALGGLLAAVVTLRSIAGQALGGTEFERLPAAVRGATQRYSRQQALRAAQCAAGLGVAAAILLGFGLKLPGATILVFLLSLVVGTGLCALSQAAVAQLAVATSTHLANAMRQHGATRAATLAFRAGISLAGIAEGVGLLGGALGYAALWFATDDRNTQCWALGAAVLGAHAVTMVSQVGGSSLHAAGKMGRRLCSDPPLAHPFEYQLDPRNPSLVLDGTGVHVGAVSLRAAEGFCCSLLCSFALLALSGQHFGVSPALATGVVWILGVVVRSLGFLGAWYVAALSRVQEVDALWSTIRNAGIALFALVTLASFGTAWWLLAGYQRWILTSCAVAGTTSGFGLVWLNHTSLARRARKVRGQGDLVPAAILPATLSSLAFDTVRETLLPLALVTLGLAAAWLVGEDAQVPEAAAWTYAAGFASIAPFVSGLAIASPLVESACGWLSLTELHTKPDFQSRISGVHQAFQRTGRAGEVYFLALPAVLGLTAAMHLGLSELSRLPSLPALSTTVSLGLVAALVGVALMVTYCALVLRHTASVVQACLQPPPRRDRAHRAAQAPEPDPEARSRYGEVLDAAVVQSLKRSPVMVAVALLAPASLFVAIRFAGTGSLAKSFVSEFLALATLTGTLIALVTEGLAGVPRMQTRAQGGPDGPLAITGSIAHFAENTVGPTARTFMHGLTALCLALLPALL